jgi:polar amino acid transport system substrate-binding protein
MLAVASCGKKEEQAADQNTAAATNTTTTAPAASNTTTTAPAASNTTATAPAPAATTNTTNTQQAAATPAASGDKIGNCDLTGKKGETPITPAVAGQLTVETNLPGPGWYNGDTPETIKDGYEYCFAANIAHRAGLDNLKVVNVAWDALVAGQTKDFDLALSQISITDERKKVVDFSVPYFSSDIGVLAKKGAAIDETSIKKAKIGVQQATTGADFVANTLKPETPAKVFPDTPSMFTALQAGQVDVAMTDTSIVLAQAGQSNGTFAVVGQYATGETYGALYPKGSANADNINKIIKALQDDGTMKALAAKYLAAAWGTDPTAIPYFKP